MRRFLILDIIFFTLCITFIILSFMIDYFFFIPIICFLPFSFRTKYRSERVHKEIKREGFFFEKDQRSELQLIKCPYCRVNILDPLAKYCSQCGNKLPVKKSEDNGKE